MKASLMPLNLSDTIKGCTVNPPPVGSEGESKVLSGAFQHSFTQCSHFLATALMQNTNVKVNANLQLMCWFQISVSYHPHS